MNNTLKAELTSYFKVVSERKKLIDNELEKCKLSTKEQKEEMEKKANIKLHKIAKGYMDKAKFDFEKGRNSSEDRIQFKDGFLERRKYRCHGFYKINFVYGYGDNGDVIQFLPAGFNLAISEVIGLIDKINKIPTDFEKKLKTKVKLMLIDDNEIKRGVVKEIRLDDNFEFSIDGFYAYGNEKNQLYYNDEIFKNCLSLIEKKKIRHRELSKKMDKYDKELDHLLNHGCENIIIATRLTE